MPRPLQPLPAGGGCPRVAVRPGLSPPIRTRWRTDPRAGAAPAPWRYPARVCLGAGRDRDRGYRRSPLDRARGRSRRAGSRRRERNQPGREHRALRRRSETEKRHGLPGSLCRATGRSPQPPAPSRRNRGSSARSGPGRPRRSRIPAGPPPRPRPCAGSWRPGPGRSCRGERPRHASRWIRRARAPCGT